MGRCAEYKHEMMTITKPGVAGRGKGYFGYDSQSLLKAVAVEHGGRVVPVEKVGQQLRRGAGECRLGACLPISSTPPPPPPAATASAAAPGRPTPNAPSLPARRLHLKAALITTKSASHNTTVLSISEIDKQTPRNRQTNCTSSHPHTCPTGLDDICNHPSACRPIAVVVPNVERHDANSQVASKRSHVVP